MVTNKTVFFLIGILLVVLGFSMLAPYIMQLIYNENSHSFVSSSFVTIFIGILFILANLEEEFKLNLKQTFLFSTLAWLMVAAFGSLPFVLSSKEFTFFAPLTITGEIVQTLNFCFSSFSAISFAAFSDFFEPNLLTMATLLIFKPLPSVNPS